MRDLRDPEKLGEEYLWQRTHGASIEKACNAHVLPYQNGKYISANPKHHHSKTPQTIGSLDE